MRRLRVPLGSPLGVRLYLHASWFPVFAALAVLTALEYGELYPALPAGVRFAMGAVTAGLFFGSLLAHELAHALAARRVGVAVRGITLFMFGGVAEIRGEVPRPGPEFRIAIVGPLTSIGLAAAFAGLSVGSTAMGVAPAEGVATVLAISNVVVAAFNLIPGLPLDGGRLLRAGIWRATGNRGLATRVAAAAGVLLGAGLAGVGVVLAVAGEWAGLWYVLVGWFLARLAVGSFPRRGGEPPPEAPALALRGDEGPAPQPRP